MLIGAAFSIAAALSLLFFAISFMFERHVERRVTTELQQFALQLAGTADIADDGTLVFDKDITDVRFQRPLSGLYWQIEVDGAVSRRSASLWDQALPELDDDDPPGEFSVHWYDLADLGALQAICRSVRLNNGAVSRRLAIQVAIDRKEVASLVSEFRADSGLAMLLLGFALLAGAAFQVLIGLRPLGQLRDRLAGILTGNAKRLEGVFPREVQPLVEELNDLLSSQERSIVKARARAGDLAHGLKTPLTVLSGLSRRLREIGNEAAGREIEAEVEAMRRHVERELARARIAFGRRRESQALKPAAERVIGTLKRLPRGNELSWRNEIADVEIGAIERADLDEVLGNLLDNARLWAKSTIVIRVFRETGARFLTIEDDGPGVPAEQLPRIVERGMLLDASRGGSGLGLAIVGDIAEAYGVPLIPYISDLGGLGIRFGLPEVVAAN